MKISPLLPLLGLMGPFVLTACAGKAIDSEQLIGLDSEPDKIEQPVATAPESTKQISGSEDIMVPSAYQITIQGETEAGAFSGVETVLEITPTGAPDRNPILVSIYPADPSPENLVTGHFFWQSYSPELPTADEHFSRVTVDGNRVQMEVNPSEQLRSDVMWFTKVTGTLAEIPDMPTQSGRLGAMPQTGTLTFQVEGSEITGEVNLTGMSDLGTPSTYQATFSGQTL